MFEPSWSEPKVPTGVFLGHHWAVVVVSLFFVIFRIAVRIKYFQKVWADDILILAAWVMLLATASLYQSQAKSLYAQYPLVTGQIESTPERLAKETTLLRVEVAEFYLLYSTLWSVKLSVLLFFRRIFNEGQSVRYLELWWYFITGFTVVSWVACLGTIPYNCLLKSLPHILKYCAINSGISYTWINLQLSFATDIVSDLMILSIPVIGLWNVRISTGKKLALMGILSLTAITIVFAIIRVGVMPNKDSSADMSWLCLWAHVETGVAVIVSCLASFRQLFVMSEQSCPRKKEADFSSSPSFANQTVLRFKAFTRKTFNKSSDPLDKVAVKTKTLLPTLEQHPPNKEAPISSICMK